MGVHSDGTSRYIVRASSRTPPLKMTGGTLPTRCIWTRDGLGDTSSRLTLRAWPRGRKKRDTQLECSLSSYARLRVVLRCAASRRQSESLNMSGYDGRGGDVPKGGKRLCAYELSRPTADRAVIYTVVCEHTFVRTHHRPRGMSIGWGNVCFCPSVPLISHTILGTPHSRC